jgi:hypothetical protein
MTGDECIFGDDYTGLEAAHIFPLAYEQYWETFDYGRWISTPNGEEIKGGKINSVQNGLLLNSSIHQLFDTYKVSINPDVSVLCFLKRNIIANYLRIIIRLCAFFDVIIGILPENI